MLTRESFAQRFAARSVFGMVHLKALPGAPLFGGSMPQVIEAALADARAIAAAGCDGLLFENFGDRPFAKKASMETVAGMTRVITEVMRVVSPPFGVNVLRNDPAAALAIAAATGGSFIRVNVHTGTMHTDQGIIEGEAAQTLRLRASLAPHVAIFADHMVKHAVPPPGIDPLQAARELRHRGLADVLIVSGIETGAAADAVRVREVAEATGAPVLVGSGLTVENAGAYPAADGAIVGTAFKQNGDIGAPVDTARVSRIVSAFRRGG